MATSLYDVLGVQRSASEAEIARAYRKLAKDNHPDLHPNDKRAEDRFKRATAAYEILKNKEQRARYDRGEIDDQGNERFAGFGGAGFDPRNFRGGAQARRGTGPGGMQFEYRSTGGGGFAGFDDVLNDLFGGRRAGGFNAAPEALRLRLEIEFTDAARGGSKRLSLPSGETVEVAIPAGVETGSTLRLRGKGPDGGDLLIDLVVREDERFERRGLDVATDQPVPLAVAVKGGKISVPTLDGEVRLSVPARSSSGRLLRLRGKGIADRKSGKRGDHLVRLLIELPEDRTALDELEAWAEQRLPVS